MKAVQLVAHGVPGAFEVREIAEPDPGVDEVVVQVKACGVNHLDLWLEAGKLPMPLALPRTPGSEVAGVVHRVGSNVSDWHPGDRVAIQSNLFCGDCEYCRAGEESNCLNGELLGVQRDGGFAEQVLVSQRSLLALPAKLDFHASAALTLAGSTAMHMLTNRVKVDPGQWVLVIGGASGVGSSAIQIARQLGARVISTGSTEARRELALRLGAETVVDTNDPSWAARIRRATDKRGVDVVVEHVGGSVLEQAFNCLARGGSIVTCGATAGREVRLNLWPLFVKQQRLVGSYGRTRADLKLTLEWAAEGRLRPVIDSTVALDQAPQALQRLRDRAVLGKILVVP